MLIVHILSHRKIFYLQLTDTKLYQLAIHFEAFAVEVIKINLYPIPIFTFPLNFVLVLTMKCGKRYR